jgi:hypothetical protein
VDIDQYVAARYGRLIEHAVLLGCAEGEAGTVVDRVLVEQRKRIRRADDPDPLVREALQHAVSGTPDRPRRRAGPLLAIVVVLAAVAVGSVLTYRPAPERLPSLFALDGGEAQQLLEHDGYDVQLRSVFSCEPRGLVLDSDPPAGQLVHRGDVVTVHTAVPSGGYCPITALARADGWDFIEFVLGDGPPPLFADHVRLVVDGGAPITLTHAEASAAGRWDHIRPLVAETARQASPTTSGMAALHVDAVPAPDSWCGVLRPDGLGERFALRLQIDTRALRDDRGCPLTVDLYRSERVIDTVVVYTPKDQGG